MSSRFPVRGLCLALGLSLPLSAFLSPSPRAALRVRVSVPNTHLYKIAWDSSKANPVGGGNADLPTRIDTVTHAKGDTVVVRGSASASAEKSDAAWKVALEQGVWKNFSATTGFDAADAGDLGDFPAPSIDADTPTAKTLVDRSFWIDSLSEANRLPLAINNLLDTSKLTAPYYAEVFGGLNIPAPGDYYIVSAGQSPGTRVAIDLNRDNVFADSETSYGKLDSSALGDTAIAPPALFGTNQGGSIILTAKYHFDAAGLYRFRAQVWSFKRGNTQPVIVGWKKPGDARTTIIPASAFGARKQMGNPMPRFVSMASGGQAITSDDTVRTCLDKAVTLKAAVDNLGTHHVTGYV